MSNSEGHQDRYRSRAAAIVGLADAALEREGLDEDRLKQLRAIKLLAQEALAASEERAV